MVQHPGRWSVVLGAAAFVALYGIPAVLGSPTEVPDWVWIGVIGAFIGLSLLAMAIHIPTAPDRIRPVLAVGFAVYLIAFALPSAHHDGTAYLGWECFIQAYVWVPEAWLANPAFLVGLALARRGQALPAAALGLVALGFGALAPAHTGVTVDVGFYVWMLGMTVALIGSAVAWTLGSRRQTAHPPAAPAASGF